LYSQELTFLIYISYIIIYIKKLEKIEAIAYTGLQGIWISRWIYLAAGALGLLVTFFEQDKRIYYLSLATAVLAASFGIAAAALYGQLAGRYSIISLDSKRKHSSEFHFSSTCSICF